MDDIAAKIGAILSDPEMFSQISALASAFGKNEQEQPSKVFEAASSEPTSSYSSGDYDMLGGVLSAIELTRRDDKNITLLRALKEHLGAERQQRADEAIRILQILKLLPLLKESGILSGFLGGEKH